MEYDLERSRAHIVQLFLIGMSGGLILYYIFYSGIEAGDFRAYYNAAELAIDGKSFVDASPPGVESYASWVYPPVVVLLYVPLTLFKSWEIAYIVWNGVSLLLAVGIANLGIKYLDNNGVVLTKYDKLLLNGAFIFAPISIMNYAQGQTNFLILALLAVGFLYIENNRNSGGIIAGVLFGLAATIKLWPALFGIWLLYRRAYKGVIAAVITGIGLQALGILLFGLSETILFIETLVEQRSATGVLGLPYLLGQLFNIPAQLATIISLMLIGPFVAFLFWQADGSPDTLSNTLTLFGLLTVGVLLVSPTVPQYMILTYFPAFLLLYVLNDTRTTARLSVGLLFVSVPLAPYKYPTEIIFALIPRSALDPIASVLPTAIVNLPLFGLLVMFIAYTIYVRSNLGH
jgi:hypothetical protein